MDKFETLYNGIIHKPLNILGIIVNRENDKVSITKEGRTIWFNKKELAKEEYQLQQSAQDVGYIDPVHVAKDGEVLDGIHRLLHDPQWSIKWHEEIDSEEKKIEFMYDVQYKRRSNKNELKALVNRDALVLKATGKYNLGDYAEIIGHRRGFSKGYVRKFLNEEYKLMGRKRKNKAQNEEICDTGVSQNEAKELTRYEMLDRLTQWIFPELETAPVVTKDERLLLLILRDGLNKFFKGD